MQGRQDTDIELWQAFKKGDEQAFADLYTSHVKILYRYSLKITQDRSLIEDCIQDLFVDIWHRRTQLSDTDSIKFYLFRIMRRKLYQRLANGFPTQNEELDHAQHLSVDSYEHYLITDQEFTFQKDRLQQGLSSLPARQREAVNLRYYHGFSYEQIAEIMDIHLQSVHNTIQKALKVLRNQFLIPISVAAVLFSLSFL